MRQAKNQTNEIDKVNMVLSKMRVSEKQYQGLRVLVVDDDLDSKDLLAIYIDRVGGEVKAVTNGEKALEAVEDFRPDIILSDIYMPGKDGIWLIEQLRNSKREQEATIPAIAITAAARDKERQSILAAGYDDYIVKPFLFEELAAKIERVLVGKKQLF